MTYKLFKLTKEEDISMRIMFALTDSNNGGCYDDDLLAILNREYLHPPNHFIFKPHLYSLVTSAESIDELISKTKNILPEYFI